MVCMVNKAVGEEFSADHFHLAIHVRVPFVDEARPPLLSAYTARHANNHVVSTGPLLACAFLDVPYPMPQLDILAYTWSVLEAGALLLKTRPELVAYGSAGRRIPARVLPQPIPKDEPLW